MKNSLKEGLYACVEALDDYGYYFDVVDMTKLYNTISKEKNNLLKTEKQVIEDLNKLNSKVSKV